MDRRAVRLHAGDPGAGPVEDAGEQAGAAVQVQGPLPRPHLQGVQDRAGQGVGGAGVHLPEAVGADPQVESAHPLGDDRLAVQEAPAARDRHPGVGDGHDDLAPGPVGVPGEFVRPGPARIGEQEAGPGRRLDELVGVEAPHADAAVDVQIAHAGAPAPAVVVAGHRLDRHRRPDAVTGPGSPGTTVGPAQARRLLDAAQTGELLGDDEPLHAPLGVQGGEGEVGSGAGGRRQVEVDALGRDLEHPRDAAPPEAVVAGVGELDEDALAGQAPSHEDDPALVARHDVAAVGGRAEHERPDDGPAHERDPCRARARAASRSRRACPRRAASCRPERIW